MLLNLGKADFEQKITLHWNILNSYWFHYVFSFENVPVCEIVCFKWNFYFLVAIPSSYQSVEKSIGEFMDRAEKIKLFVEREKAGVNLFH